MTISAPRTPGTDFVLTLQFTGSTDHRRLAELADALRATASRLAPEVDTHASVDPVAPLLIDLPAREVRLDGSPIPLSHTEFEVLSHLASRPRTVVSRRLMLQLSGNLGERDNTGRSIDVHVSRVRTKLGRFGGRVSTVRGSGYRFDPDPQIHVVQS